MNTGYLYDVWDGTKIVGSFWSLFPLVGTHVVVPETSILKQRYRARHKVIKIPINYRVVKDDGVETVIRKTLDVRKKSKRQIEIICGDERSLK